MPTIFDKVIRYFRSMSKDNKDNKDNKDDQDNKKAETPKIIPNTSYRDALLRNINPTSIPPGITHYSGLGDKINQIVDDNVSKRPYNDWWKVDFSVEGEYQVID